MKRPVSANIEWKRVREDADDPVEKEEEVPSDMIDSDEEHFKHTDPPSAKTGSPKVPSADAVHTKFINMCRQFVCC